MSPALERLTGFDATEIIGGSCLRVDRCTECLRGCWASVAVAHVQGEIHPGLDSPQNTVCGIVMSAA